ncbi:hypothetical protein [Synechococcus elongatus]|uniref:Uncharacterized protein n=1 Tax=Synechococcus elongatus PCC 11801 TaxID=2219813 RepID=A0AAN1QLN3_SYNEL|nr:hypothetical protein [Synechococcus elongatus]AZB71427.1 hypothetical protein DOP62_00625 [Synechococcus elongatus PCC 11801]
MGRLVSLEIVTPIEQAPALFELIIQKTTPSTEPELRSILATKTAPPDICLCFVVALDEVVKTLDTQAIEQTDHVAIGCVWTAFRFGDRYLLTSATSSYSAMAKAFEESQSIQSLFTDIAQQSASEALFLLDDWNQSQLLWRSDRPMIQNDKEYSNPVDRLCQEIMMPFSSTQDRRN